VWETNDLRLENYRSKDDLRCHTGHLTYCSSVVMTLKRTGRAERPVRVPPSAQPEAAALIAGWCSPKPV